MGDLPTTTTTPDGEPSGKAGRGSAFRSLLPREHGLIAWVVQPLLLGWLLASDKGQAGLAVVAAVAGFGAFNAVRADRSGPASIALGIAGIATAVGMWGSAHPWGWLALGGGGAVVLGGGRRLSKLPRSLGFELAGLAILGGVGVGVALLGDAPASASLAAAVALLAWEVLGLCWIRGQLARLLPRREPVPHAAYVAFAAAMTAAVTAIGLGHSALALVPLLYGLRVIAHAPPSRAADARRLGLTELAWGLAATLLLAIR